MKDRAIGEIRLVATMMIVLLHMDDFLRIFGKNPYANFFLDAGVGIFFAISGYLYGQKTIKDIKSWYINTYFKIVFPAFLFTVLAASLNRFVVGGKSEIGSVFASLFGFQYVIENNVDGCYHLWFITYIFLCYALIPPLQRIDFSDIKNTAGFIACFSLFALIILILCSYKVIGLSAFYPLEFVLFYMMSRRETVYEISDIDWLKVVIVLVGVGVAIVWCFYTYYGFERLPLGSTLVNLQSQFEVGISAAMFLLFHTMLCRLHKSKSGNYPKILEVSDKISFGVYVVNYYMLYHSGKICISALPIPRWLGAVGTFVEIVLIGALLSFIYSFFKKIMNHLIKMDRWPLLTNS